ncbi:methyltransferase domain-containing protein, partial [Pseudochelatococcus sp. B33]
PPPPPAIALQQGRVATVDKAEGDIRILKERLRVLGVALATSPLRVRNEDAAYQGAAPAPLGEFGYWPRLLLERGDSFLSAAYRVLLDRNIDPAGLESYRSQLNAGRGRLEILCDITLSPEFRRRGVDDGDLRRYRKVYQAAHRIERTPLRFLARALRGWLRRAENGIRASLAADIAMEARDHVSAFYDSLGIRTRFDSGAAVLADDARLDAFYLAFEDAMRGPEDEIKAGLAYYLETIAAVTSVADGPILDLGCGRGEWLSLLGENGYTARGIDLSPTMVGICRAKGLDATVIDALSALRALPDNSLSVVSGFHIIEHLPFPILFSVFEETYRALQPGGLMLFETPNPENLLVGAHTFYHDPTHRHPLTPSSMAFLARFHGFETIDFARLRPYPPEALVTVDSQAADRLNGHLYGPQDYAILARKGRADESGQGAQKENGVAAGAVSG